MEILDIAIGVIILIFVFALFFISSNEIKKSLEMTKASEKLLEEQRESLIERIELKTDQLKKSENARMNELAHMAEFGRLSQGLFHDLMTPLTSVVLHTEKLKTTSTEDLKSTQNTLNKAIQASQKMASYIKNIRETMKTQSAKKEFVIEEELSNIIDLLAYKARLAKAEIIVKSGNKNEYYGDPVQLRQVFSNLLSNALDSFEPINDARKRLIEITISSDEKQLKIAVKDNGSGIDENHINKIFDPFFTTKSPDKGTGIGLTTVKSIIEKDFGGKLSVASRINEGTIFSISIPKNLEIENQPEN